MTVVINGVTYEAERDFSIGEHAGSKTVSTVSIKIAEGQDVPHAGDIITVLDDVYYPLFQSCNNGSFENGSAGWELTGGISLTSERSKDGTKSLKSSAVSAFEFGRQNIPFTDGHKIYVTSSVYINSWVGGLIGILAYDYATTLNPVYSVFDTNVLNAWQRKSFIKIAANGGVRVHAGSITSGTHTSYIDCVMAYDLGDSDSPLYNLSAPELDALLLADGTPYWDNIRKIYAYSNTIFWGTCGIPTSPRFNTGYEALIYQIICGNANTICSYRIINEAFQDYTVTQIVTALFNSYIDEEGITLGQISNIGVTLEAYTAQDYNLQNALNELADLVGAVWEISNDRKFYFLVQEDFPVFPQTIDIDFMMSDLQHTENDYKTRTIQYISGATEYTSPQIETFTYDDNASFSVAFPVAEKPTITVDGTPVPTSKIGVTGLSSDNPDVVFLFSYNSQTITYKVLSEYMTTGATVVITYIGMFPIRLSVSNDDKIAEIAAKTGTSGKREMVETAYRTKTRGDAAQLAASLLSQYSESTEELRFWLPSDMLYRLGYTIDDTKLLTQFEFNLPTLHITGTYIVVERTMTPMYSDVDNIKQRMKISMRLMNRNFVKSYGETISDLRNRISDLTIRPDSDLTIRPDDVIVVLKAVSETKAVSESYDYSYPIPFYPTNILISNNLFLPAGFPDGVYPT